MYTCDSLLSAIRSGTYDAILSGLYALDGAEASLEAGRKRASHVVQAFQNTFQPEHTPVALFSSPGRTEIGGNHTDHQRGHVLCGSVDMDMLCCAAPNGTNTVHICSEGYRPFHVDLSYLEPVKGEEGSSAALTRGIASKITSLGHSVGGFDAYISSNVLSGSGLSSSAAYEVLIGNILNHFFCQGSLDAIQIAKIGQYAENAYFGKPCGLMDQMGASVGGTIALDFSDPTSPTVNKVNFDFSQSGHVLCIVDTGSCHADLTEDYAEITQEMGNIAAHFGKRFLREVPESEFRAVIPSLRVRCGDRAVLRALHFYNDDRMAILEAQALEQNDFSRFLSLVNASGLSSSLYLQNTWSISAPKHQAIPLALAIGRELLDGTGAIRVHGGGFAGTIQAFVPLDKQEHFQSGMEKLLGAGKCHPVHIRPVGGCVVAQ